MRDLSPNGDLFLAQIPEDLEELYAIYQDHATICPFNNHTFAQFKEITERLVELAQYDMWIYREPSGEATSYQLTELQGQTLKIISGVYKSDINLATVFATVLIPLIRIANNTGCTSIYAHCHKSAVEANKFISETLGKPLTYPKYTTDPDQNEYELKI